MAEQDSASPSPTEKLCQSCGLCCNGSVHNWTNLRAQEITWMQSLGLESITLPDGSPAFTQPCPVYKDPVCSIYTQRPHACRDFECRLYQSLQSGEIDLDQALEFTAHARELIAALRSQMLEPDESLPLERQVRYQWRFEPPPAASAILSQLVTLLRTRFGVRWSQNVKRKRAI